MAMAKILVLDDEPLIALMLADWLEEQGHEAVGPAHSELQAEDVLRTTTIDAAILDVSLGDHNCRRIAEWLRASSVPFAFATGHSVEAVWDDFKAVPRISKPFNFGHVSIVLDDLLAGRASS